MLKHFWSVAKFVRTKIRDEDEKKELKIWKKMVNDFAVENVV